VAGLTEFSIMTTQQPRPQWLILLRPRWLAWHAIAVLLFCGMLLLGDWQLHRAESGNELSWAYTFEWPLFAIFGVYFWTKTVRDELRQTAAGKQQGIEPAGGVGQPPPSSGAALSSGAVADGAVASGAVADGALADSDAYLARLKAEVGRHGRWHGWR
jgi:hypothetical protein